MFKKSDWKPTNIIKRFFKGTYNVIKGEISEIANLQPTEEDFTQGEKMGEVFVTVCASMGYPCPAVAKNVMAKVFAYGIRDMKDGINCPENLIVGRIVKEIRGE